MSIGEVLECVVVWCSARVVKYWSGVVLERCSAGVV